MVFYRKYRPQKISELDLTQVRDTFTHLLASQDIPHAFLFTGPKGLGKTSSARILAKAINCQEKIVQGDKKSKTANNKLLDASKIEPCNVCDICIAITNGSHVDVIEIDAASNRGIDEIRELRERVKFAPAQLSKKIYIIDEVHMLTTEAFNALLKTLEEPPSHVMFILCTTEEWKIPTTVASRTFHVRFEKPTKDEMVRSLQRIVEGEKLVIEKGVLESIYELSDGAFRNGAKTLEELAFQSGKQPITADTLEKVFKTNSTQQYVSALITHIATSDLPASLKTIQAIADSGIDFKIIHEKLVHILHEQLLIKSQALQGEEILELSLVNIKQLLELFNTSFSQLRFAVLPQLPLEIAVMEYFIKNANSHGRIQSEVPTIVTVTQQEVEDVIAQPVTETVQPAPPKRGRPDVLSRLIDAVKKENHSVAGILRGCSMGSMENGVMTIESKFTFHGERLMEPTTKKLLEKYATEVVGKPTTVEIKIMNQS
ncbi:MAG TPA: DNA polymerase III subunit gamma/tau [Candidatus Levybacteria bacterium]|nr:DNA polymerase III subunit gamma/tau [Candidatus Levybacteria bacterium]